MKVHSNQPTVPASGTSDPTVVNKTESLTKQDSDSFGHDNTTGRSEPVPHALESPKPSGRSEQGSAVPAPSIDGLVETGPTGLEQVQELQTTLNKVPNFAWTQVEKLLNNQAALRLILDDPTLATSLSERTPEAVQAFRETMDGFVQRGAFEVAVFTGAIGSASDAMKSLETFLIEQPTARFGLQLGLANDVMLGAIVSDLRDGTLNAEMLGRFIDGTPTKGDLAVIVTYIREQGGGALRFDGQNPAFKGLMNSLELPGALHTENIQSIDVNADQITIAFDESKPLIQRGIFDVNLTSPIEIEMVADPDEGLILRPKLEGDWALDAIFLKTHLNVTGNALMDTLLEVLFKILLAPVLLVAGLTVEYQDTTIRIDAPQTQTQTES